MKASEARKAVEEQEQFQLKEQKIIQEGERYIKEAISYGNMKCSSGLNFNNVPHWHSIIRHWKGLGYTVEWNLGGGYNPSQYPNTLRW